MSINAYALVRITPNRVKDVVRQTNEIKGVQQVHAVTGPYDAIVFIESEDMKELGKVVLADIHSLEGVIDTTTCLVVDY
ncbi:MAG: Lrp/AsnC ligand binding domain-containing protein [Calditrichia bacterium]